MQVRITIMLDKDIEKKLRKLQAEKIQQESRNVSFSEIVNDYLEKGIKKSR